MRASVLSAQGNPFIVVYSIIFLQSIAPRWNNARLIGASISFLLPLSRFFGIQQCTVGTKPLVAPNAVDNKVFPHPLSNKVSIRAQRVCQHTLHRYDGRRVSVVSAWPFIKRAENEISFTATMPFEQGADKKSLRFWKNFCDKVIQQIWYVLILFDGVQLQGSVWCMQRQDGWYVHLPTQTHWSFFSVLFYLLSPWTQGKLCFCAGT